MKNKKEISRQRRWQIKKVQEGFCSICGKGKVYKSEKCFDHYIEHKDHHREHMREYWRKKTGYYERKR